MEHKLVWVPCQSQRPLLSCSGIRIAGAQIWKPASTAQVSFHTQREPMGGTWAELRTAILQARLLFPLAHPCLCGLPLSISALLPVNQKLFQPPCWEIPKLHANTRVQVTAKTLLSQVFVPNESLLAPRSNLDTVFWVTPWQWLSGAALLSPWSPL